MHHPLSLIHCIKNIHKTFYILNKTLISNKDRTYFTWCKMLPHIFIILLLFNIIYRVIANYSDLTLQVFLMNRLASTKMEK